MQRFVYMQGTASGLFTAFLTFLSSCFTQLLSHYSAVSEIFFKWQDEREEERGKGLTKRQCVLSGSTIKKPRRRMNLTIRSKEFDNKAKGRRSRG